MNTEVRALAKARLSSKEFGEFETESVSVTFHAEEVEIKIVLIDEPKRYLDYHFRFPLSSEHLDHNGFSASHTYDDIWSGYRYNYTLIAGGATTVIDESQAKAHAAFNLKMKVTEDSDSGAAFPEFEAQGWFDYSIPNRLAD